MQHWSKKEKHEGINRNAEFRNRLHFTYKPDLGDPARKEGISNMMLSTSLGRQDHMVLQTQFEFILNHI